MNNPAFPFTPLLALMNSVFSLNFQSYFIRPLHLFTFESKFFCFILWICRSLDAQISNLHYCKCSSGTSDIIRVKISKLIFNMIFLFKMKSWLFFTWLINSINLWLAQDSIIQSQISSSSFWFFSLSVVRIYSISIKLSMALVPFSPAAKMLKICRNTYQMRWIGLSIATKLAFAVRPSLVLGSHLASLSLSFYSEWGRGNRIQESSSEDREELLWTREKDSDSE